MSHFRVELTLSEVSEYTDSGGYKRDQATTVAKIELTAGTPGSAMAQAQPHVDALAGWHYESTSERATAEQEASKP